ncbi:hypothetical protein LSCM4_08257 [Leishmania orientalis]|uniref:Helicase ATP-binding domain-containing protein n=1 Tax=Leishmania orientalis TaxID=2249476 RepID=A0A836L4A9_9TRYP|nr:hypothetical protein LSCM4_08257 [Leishmania orientalis]
MHQVGPYQIPFPYAPYPLQEHAMTALRDYLEHQCGCHHTENTSSRCRSINVVPAAVSSTSPQPSSSMTRSTLEAKSFRSRVVVLESPTGTGKSQMLLNSVLSFLFETVENAMHVDGTASACSSTHPELPAVIASAAAHESESATLAHPPSSPALEEVLRQRQLEEEIMRVRRERRARVRAHRRQIRQARNLMRLQQSTNGGEPDFLLTQDPLAWYAEQPAVMTMGLHDGDVGDLHSTSWPSASSSSSCSSSSSASDGDVDDDAEGQLEKALSAIIPLRKPKVYFASRTHTQLQQLMEDLQRTAFAQRQLRPRQRTIEPLERAGVRSAGEKVSVGGRDGCGASSNSFDSLPPACPPAAAPPGRSSRPQQQQQPRRLTAVHVAGRLHLCLNADLRRKAGGNSDRLNFYCREAMRFERSKQGRQNRRQQQEHPRPQPRDPTGSPTVRDIEAATGEQQQQREDDKGCVYCVESHLRSLMTYLRDEQQRADAAAGPADASSGRGSASGNDGPPSSVYPLERLRRLGADLQACPYIATRLLLRGADVAFIPYGHVLDEGQRAALLGGSATNPATAAEAAVFAVPGDSWVATEAGGGGVDGESSGLSHGDVLSNISPSLGAVLYHRRQRVTATAAFRRRRGRQGSPQQQQQRDGSLIPGAKTRRTCEFHVREEEEDAIWHVMACSAPPSFRGDILVFDEAHNIADHCRSASTVTVAPWQLRLAQRLAETYLERYASRLLTRNKQRLRELIHFLRHLSGFCERIDSAVVLGEDGEGDGDAAPSVSAPSSLPVPLSPSSSATEPAAMRTRVLPFHAFLFDAGIDSVDVYALLTFLADSQLLMKLQGFVSHLLDAEPRQGEVMRTVKAATAATRTKVVISGTDNRTRSVVGVKRQRSSGIAPGASDTRSEAQRQHRFLQSLDILGGHEKTAEEERPPPCLPLAELISQQLLPASVTAAGAATYAGAAASPDPVQLRASAAEALQRVERLLCALYVSDATSTRVLWTPLPSPARHGGYAVRQGTLKIMQLEPGTHTFAPLVLEARAVVLAGGTMQPLAFTCGPLLPPQATMGGGASGDCGTPNATGRASVKAAAGGTGSSDCIDTIDALSHGSAVCTPHVHTFHLISEGHVVPPSSVQVWALGTGPSGLRMELSHQALALRSDAASAASHAISPHAHRVLAEVGCTLLNLARVLPPAGAICFFTSYDVMDAVVAVLESTGYYAQINEVKRIFTETRNGGRGGGGGWERSTASGSDGGSGEAVAQLLREYQEWIGGEVDSHSDVARALGSSATSLCADAAASQQRRSRRGAFLFAVIGGRLSEGINFADDLGRAVVVLGMPYANPTDVELQMSLKHIVTTRLMANANAGCRGTRGPAGSASVPSLPSSSPFTCTEEWGLYMDGMMRTVNQCIGRCIRHAGDYATIILLDARYTERQDVRRRVSAWLQPSMSVAQTFGQCFSGVREFFARRRPKA